MCASNPSTKAARTAGISGMGRGVPVVAERSRSKTIAGLVLLTALAAAGMSSAAVAAGRLKLPSMVLKIGVGKHVIQRISFGKNDCRPGRAVSVVASIVGGTDPNTGATTAGNAIEGTARCDKVVVTDPTTATDDGSGAIVTSPVAVGVQVQGRRRCVGNYLPAQPRVSSWVVWCTF